MWNSLSFWAVILGAVVKQTLQRPSPIHVHENGRNFFYKNDNKKKTSAIQLV